MTGAQLSWYAGAVQRRLLAVLLMVGVLLMPRQEGLQGWMPAVSLIGVAALVIILRSIR